jgi:FkbM family methyltransferase
MSYSQNNEERIILDFFGEEVGSLLSIGENDGITLSNSRALIERGWMADLVEPSPVAFSKLKALYKDSSNIKLHNIAIGTENGLAPFYDSGSLLNSGDESLVSTLSIVETKRWGGCVKFEQVEVEVQDFKTFRLGDVWETYDFISLDAEGFDLDILKQIDFDSLGVRLICVEFNGINEQAYWDVVHPFGFKLIHKNGENLIYARI